MSNRIVFIILLISFLGILNLLTSCFEEKQPQHLNVLFIAVDDLRPEMNCYGNRQIISPNIDRLAQNGVLFQHAYCQQAICMASRASIFTGYYANANQIYSCLSVDDLMPEALTINEFFKKSGYDVYAIGKLYHHQEDHIKQFGEGWLETQKMAQGETKGRGYLTTEAQATVTPEGRGPAWESAEVEDDEYRDGFYADWVVNKLNELKTSQKPFFLGVGFQKPHLPFNAPTKYWDLYDPEQIETADNPFFPENGSLYGKHNFGELRNYTNIPKGNSELSEEMQIKLIHGYQACVSYTDAQIGKVLDALEENGLKDNTVIVLWGDHGWKLGEHGMWCKHTAFEVDTRGALIISAPNISKNVKTNAFAEYVDVFPTLADLCGFKIPTHLQGESLLPVLTDADSSVKDQAFSIWPSYRGASNDKSKKVIGYSVRTRKYRYTEWIRIDTGEIMDSDLFDHETDPNENRNVVNDKKYEDELPALTELIKDFRERTENIEL